MPTRLCICLIVGCLIVGCNGQKTHTPTPEPITQPDISFQQLVKQYNARRTHLKQMQASILIELSWTDEKDQTQHEQGDGQFIYRRPGDLAITVGKAGNILMWIGCDAQRYWLLDLRDERIGFVGTHARFNKPGTRRLAIPIPARQLMTLAGLTELPTEPKPVFQQQGELYRLTYPADRKTNRLKTILWIDPNTMALKRTQLINAKDQIVMQSQSADKLIDVDTTGVPYGAMPQIPKRLSAELPIAKASMRISFSDATDGGDGISNRQFNFDKLAKRIWRVNKIVDLDQPGTVDPDTH